MGLAFLLAGCTNGNEPRKESTKETAKQQLQLLQQLAQRASQLQQVQKQQIPLLHQSLPKRLKQLKHLLQVLL